MSFQDTLAHHIQSHNSLLCVGLDPDPARIPAHLGSGATAVYAFCRDIIAATHDVVAAFKPNIAFFEAMGPAGIEALTQLMVLPRHNLWILDAKRGDIGNTASAYASAAFDQFNADAITVNPYLGGDALAPFLERPERGAFILCRTSNPGSRDIQELPLADGRPLDDGEGSSSGYGYGWSLFEQNGASYATHGGSWMGTATQYRRNLTTGVTVIVLANGEDADAAGLAEEIEAALP